MKEKAGKILKSRVFLCVIVAIVFGIIGVSAATYFPSGDVTYDNTESGLKSTDVQGAIDELYGVCNNTSVPGAGGEILDKVSTVTFGDGLYAEDKYVYKGANPNNYITFNGETAGWRIISIENDGTIKIIKSVTLGTRVWDNNYNDADWTTASLNTYLNQTYYNSLNSTAKDQIVSYYWSPSGMTGKVGKGNIAILTVPDYLRANSNVSNCGTGYLNSENVSTCKNTNWIYNMLLNDTTRNGIYVWTMTSYENFSGNYQLYDYVYRLNFSTGTFILDMVANGHSHVYPVVYLSSSVKITGGDGSQSNPYVLE